MRIRAAAGLLALATSAASPAFAVDVVDQHNDQEFSIWVSASTYEPLGQQFVPTLSRIDWAELWAIPFRVVPLESVRLSLEVHAGEVTEFLLAVSGPIEFPNTSPVPRIFRFDFQPGVALVPGATYVLVVRDAGVLNWGVRCENDSGDDSYPSGNGILSGIVAPALDLWFREGIVESQVPSHAETWGAVKAAYRH